jgi:murein DD-endopeptidase MepM/ murein hydrolase activator NlpD
VTARELGKGVLQVAAACALGGLAWGAASRWWWPVETERASPVVAAKAEAEPEALSAERIPALPIDGARGLAAEVIEPPPASGTDLEILRSRDLLFPVPGVDLATLHDDFADARSGGRRHEALDILAPRNTPVHAVADGRIAKLFESEFGGLTVYQFDGSGRYCFYYAHLERYPRGLAEGMEVARGETVGFVGTSGNAPKGTPHLHFAIYRLGPEQRWWEGEPINPFRIWSPD